MLKEWGRDHSGQVSVAVLPPEEGRGTREKGLLGKSAEKRGSAEGSRAEGRVMWRWDRFFCNKVQHRVWSIFAKQNVVFITRVESHWSWRCGGRYLN